MTTSHTKPEWAQSKREKANAERVAQGLKPKRRIMPWVVLGLVVVAIVAFVVTRPQPVEVVAETTPVEVVKQIRRSETALVAPSVLSQTVKVTGTLSPSSQTDVAAQVGGRILSLAVQPGDAVKEGNVIAQLDTENLLIQLSQQRATAEATRAQQISSEQQLQRTEELARQGLTSPSSLEQARAADAALRSNMTALENVVKAAELAYANATVRAPISGIVSARSVQQGQTVAAGTPMLTIVNLDTMEYQASASVSSSALVAPGQTVEMNVSGIEGETFIGTVTRVNPVAAAGTRSVQIYITTENTGQRLRGGMFATGQITVAQKDDAIAVPALALREDAEGIYVLKLEGDTLVRQAVVPGAKWNRGTTVEVSGVEVGDTVVVVPLAQLAAGERFELIED